MDKSGTSLTLEDVLALVAANACMDASDPSFQRYVKLLISAEKRGLVDRVTPIRTMDSADDKYDNVFVSGGLTAEGEDYLSNYRQSSASSEEGRPNSLSIPSESVMLVVGRNRSINRSLIQFLHALALRPREFNQLLRETGSATPYIGKAVATGFQKSQAAVVLFTPDDEVKLRSELAETADDAELAYSCQPRPNVLFEAGMAFALHPDRTILVEIGNVKVPSDLSGLHSLRFDGSPTKRHEFVERLRTAGCTPDTSGTEWLHAGKFDIPSASASMALHGGARVADHAQLAPNELSILKYLAKRFDAWHREASEMEIAESLGLLRSAVAISLASLRKRQLVRPILTVGEGAAYEISEAGLTYLSSRTASS